MTAEMQNKFLDLNSAIKRAKNVLNKESIKINEENETEEKTRFDLINEMKENDKKKVISE